MTYVPPDKTWTLRLRSTESFKLEIEDAVRLWKLHAAARGDDVEQIDMSYFVRHSLQADVKQAFAEYGRPKTETEWKAVEAAIKLATKPSSKR